MEKLEEHQISVGDFLASNEWSPARNIRSFQMSLDGLEITSSVALLVLGIVDFLVV